MQINYSILKIIKDFTTASLPPKTALSLGMFDGVHLGHRSIIKTLTSIAKEKNLTPSVLSFWPHPRLVFDPNANLKLLNSIEEKSKLLSDLRVEYLFLKTFDEEFWNLTGEEFVKEFLIKKLNVKYLMVGHDHVFGKNKSGNFDLLKKMASTYDFEVVQMEAVRLENKNISSTQIRNALKNGDILHANEMLGYFYPISGKVIDGKKIGRTIDYPTANLEINPLKILPQNGAYITEVLINKKLYKGMTSIGTNPTFNGDSLQIETYILDFSDDIYGEKITLYFRDFLHEEIRFDNIEKLIEKLDEDKRLTEEFRF